MKGLGLYILTMTVLRFIFFIVNRKAFSGISITEFLLSFTNGIRFDLNVMLVITGLLYFLLHIPGNWKYRSSRTRWLFWLPLAAFIPVVGISLFNVHYYADSGRHLSYEIFTVYSDRHDILSVVEMMAVYGWTILVFISLSALLIWAWKKSLAGFYRRKGEARIKAELLWLAVFILFLIMGLRGKIVGRPLGMSDAFILGQTELGHLALNPIYTIGRSILDDGSVVPTYLEEEKAIKVVRKLLGSERTTSWLGDDTPLFRKTGANKNGLKTKYNVVLLLMESWAPRFLGAYGGDRNTTPEFDDLAENGLLFEHFYAAGNRTIEGLCAVCLGLPSFNRFGGPVAGSYLSGSLEQNSYVGIGDILGEQGYTSIYIHGESSRNFRHASLPAMAGFDKHLGRDELKLTKADTEGPWGGWDHVLLDKLYDVISTEKEPFFAMWISLTNHPPYILPDDTFVKSAPGDPDAGFKDSLRYTDYHLGRFFERIRKEDQFNRTIFIITADHATRSTATMEERYHIPLLIYAPAIIKPGRDRRVGSQLDLTPTIIDLLGIEGYHHAMGTSLLDDAAERFAFLNFMQGYGWITGREILEVNPDGQPLRITDLDTGQTVTGDIKGRTETLLSFVQTAKTLSIENRFAPKKWEMPSTARRKR